MISLSQQTVAEGDRERERKGDYGEVTKGGRRGKLRGLRRGKKTGGEGKQMGGKRIGREV